MNPLYGLPVAGAVIVAGIVIMAGLGISYLGSDEKTLSQKILSKLGLVLFIIGLFVIIPLFG